MEKTGKRRANLDIFEMEVEGQKRDPKRRRIQTKDLKTQLQRRMETSPEEREKVRKEYLEILSSKKILQDQLREVEAKEKSYLEVLPPIVLRDINYISTGFEPRGDTAKDQEILNLIESYLALDSKIGTLKNLDLSQNKLTISLGNKELLESKKNKILRKLDNIKKQKENLQGSIAKKHREKLRNRLKRDRSNDEFWKDRWERLGKKGLIQERFKSRIEGSSDELKRLLKEDFPEILGI